jgi:hypothetical protein
MNVFTKICWGITAFATLPAAICLLATFSGSASAPQEAAGAAMACAIVIIPYVFTRAIEGLAQPARS